MPVLPFSGLGTIGICKKDLLVTQEAPLSLILYWALSSSFLL